MTRVLNPAMLAHLPRLMLAADAPSLPQLVAEASAVAKHAYSPYSGFHVGAALQTKSGNIYRGCNVENVSYPVGSCAERNAIAAAVANEGPGMEIESIALIAEVAGAPRACAPCGACRQAISEFGRAARVFYRTSGLTWRCDAISSLLPDAFDFRR